MTIPKTRNTDLVEQFVRGEILLYDLKTNKAFCLNETSAFIWQLCDGRNSIIEISRQTSKRFKENLDEDFVWLAVEQFQRDGLLDKNFSIEVDYRRLSRREVIQKVGFASMIALPLITSIVAPHAVNAQSTCANANDACTPSNYTQSNCCGGLRCFTDQLFCVGCVASNAGFIPCATVGGCGNCDSTPYKNLCCNSGTATNNGAVCQCP